MTKGGEFNQIQCEDQVGEAISQLDQTGLCLVNIVMLMSEPFSLYYGDYISAKI